MLLPKLLLTLYKNVVLTDIIKTMKDIAGHISVTKTYSFDSLQKLF